MTAAATLAQQLVDGQVSLAEWEAGMRAFIRTTHREATAIALGGMDQVSKSMWGFEGSLVKKQYRFLEGFAADIRNNPEQWLTGRLAVRAEMYGKAEWSTFEQVLTKQAELDGMEEEMRVLGDADHCDDCLELEGYWAPIGTLPVIGDSQCKTNCHCTKIYRKAGAQQEGTPAAPLMPDLTVPSMVEEMVGERAPYSRMAADRGFPVEKYVVRSGQGPEFNVGGAHFIESGHFEPATGRIVVYTGEAITAETDTRMAHVISHEVNHARWQTFVDKIPKDNVAIGESVQGSRAKWLITAAGDLKTAAAKAEFWAYDIEQTYLSGEVMRELVAGDGVTPYSRAYWTWWGNQRIQYTSQLYRAIDETLSEMAALVDAGAKLEDIAPSQAWKELYERISSIKLR